MENTSTKWPTTVLVRIAKRPSLGLGIVVTPRPQHLGLVIAELIRGSEAIKTGLLRPGDQILKVNNKDLEHLPYEQCLHVLQELPVDEEVEILIRVPDGYTTRLVTTFNEEGVSRTTRITSLIPSSESPSHRRRRESIPDEKIRSLKASLHQNDVGGVANDNKLNNGVSFKSSTTLIPIMKENGLSSHVQMSPERPATLSANSNQGSRKSSVSSPSRRPVRLKNIISGHESIETLFLKSTETVPCSPTKCMGSIMSCPSKRAAGTPRPKDEVLRDAKHFFDQYFCSIKRMNSPSHVRRWKEIMSEVESSGTYELKETELVYGAKLAWRNAPRCIGRIQWSKLQVFDARYVSTAREMFEALCNHIKYATNKGNIRSAITIFPQRTDGLRDCRVWNTQLIMYAGYKQEDGTIIGDPASADFTELCLKLGWKGAGQKWDILPLVLSANGHDPQVFDLPEELVMRVHISHPKYPWFKDLNIQWYALPAVSSMLFDVGGLEFPAAPFNGWYMVTEIGARDLCDPHRFNILEEVATRLGVDMRAPSTLWKDRAVVEVNYAVIYSFQKANVTIVDHHTASESFMKHWDNELRLRGGCPADWVWIVPPLSGSLTPVFHQELLLYNLKPSYEYQDPPWKTHVWEKDRESSGNGPRTPSRKFRFKEIARAVKFTSNLFGMALSRRIKATILFATETGRSEHYAKMLGDIFSHAFNANVICMVDYDVINLEHETLLLVVTSTFGNGDPPENGEAFARSLQAIKITGETTPDAEYISTCMPFVRMNSMPLESLEDEGTNCTPTTELDDDIGPLSNVRFAVFALGSSAYPNFCSFGRYVDSMLGELGGERMVKMGTGDELCGQEYTFSQWAQEAFQVACDVFYVGDDINLSDVKASLQSNTTWSPEKVRLVEVPEPTDICAGVSKGTNRKVVPCILKERKVLFHEEDSRKTLLIVMSTQDSPSMKYLPGDHVGIYAANRKEIVDGILSRMTSTCPDPDKPFQLQLRKTVQTLDGLNHRWYPHERIPALTMRTALTRYLDITTPPGQQFLRDLETMATDEGEKRKMKLLATDSVRYEDWKSQLYPNLLETLEYFSSVVPTPEFLITHLSSLQPRFYSISSAPEYHPGHIHLTVAVVVYRTQSDAQHYGVCSNYLESLPIGSETACFVRSAPNFRLSDNCRVPIIMVGPGTGIAPFRSFWQQRYIDINATSGGDSTKRFGNMTLLIGCRHPKAELHQEETQQMKECGVLANVHSAYSRVPGKPKRYVQHILRESAEKVYKEVIQERGHFYVCGDVSMAEDVNQTLRVIIQELGQMNPAAVDNVIKRLQEENRYHEDIFGITLKTAEVTNRGREEAKNRKSTSSS
ncbi:nitric oxide synthase-like protein isoform X4 [Parasteatoda tepidariorum]|uniref:nitric oxide synthase-like protein isoform X4 n=1 Tax=Parasteatoda tepidariorum TaxID=114398 RepID=UPI0039BD34A8